MYSFGLSLLTQKLLVFLCVVTLAVVHWLLLLNRISRYEHSTADDLGFFINGHLKCIEFLVIMDNT